MRPGTRLRWHALKPFFINEIAPYDIVLDIGGFDGSLVSLLSRTISKLNVIVVDMDKLGLQKAKGFGLGTVCGSALDVPLRSQSADVVLCLDILEHIEQDDRVLKEISRLLKIHGKFILSTPMAQGINFPFLNREKSRAVNFRWGHFRLGYEKAKLCQMLNKNGLQAKIVSGYFNAISRFFYSICFLLKARTPFRSCFFNAAVFTEPYLKQGVQEHIFIGNKRG